LLWIPQVLSNGLKRGQEATMARINEHVRRLVLYFSWAYMAWFGNRAVHGQQPPDGDRVEINLAGPRAPDDARPVVGAYYYPWYGVSDRPVERDWVNLLRQKLVPPQAPRAGPYRSDDPAVIADHIGQSRQAGLDFWALSWWGPGSTTDRTIREAILKHPDAGQLRYAVLYESTGRLGRFSRPRYGSFVDDVLYLREHVFSDPNYLKINGRPVFFIYLTREYFRNRGHEELAALRERVPEIYIVGDDVFGPNYRAEWAEQFDAVTAYDVYGQSTGIHKATRRAVRTLADNYAAAREAANSGGAAFIPAVAPGYNDTAVRDGHPGTPRYLVDEPESREGDLFRALIREAALPNLDARCGRLMMVTSFNEWYEDTQIEATAGTSETTSLDNSASQKDFAGGDRYVDYGGLYLDILNETTRLASTPDAQFSVAVENARRGDLEAALAALEPVLAAANLDPALRQRAAALAARLLHVRGVEHFRHGRIAESVADFDREVEYEPSRAAEHWQRGIAYYYLEEFEKGARQFELHRTVNPQDVENAAWHFLCVVRSQGGSVEAAREGLIPVSRDERLPMAQVQQLFAGTLKPEDVRAVGAQAGDAAEFYADLYVGLYYEAMGNREESLRLIQRAVANPAAEGNYMGDVARVHVALRSEVTVAPTADPGPTNDGD
jgi:glycoprotein endo-alpha-1,2-mannosidase